MSEKFPKFDGNGRQCGVDCACSQGELRRRTDSQPAPMRESLAIALRRIAEMAHFAANKEVLYLAAETLERSENNNAAMIHELVRAGYKDIPARVDAQIIRRLLGYVTPSV